MSGKADKNTLKYKLRLACISYFSIGLRKCVGLGGNSANSTNFYVWEL